METVRVHLGERSYDIAVDWVDPAGVGGFARDRCTGRLALIVTDHHVAGHAAKVADSLTAAGFRVESHTLAPGEEQKSLRTAEQLYGRLADLRADRHTVVVAVGGGVIGDVAGFVAATFARGVPLLMVPTTLLAMVDSSVGGKVAVNHPKAKNLIGAFHQPIGVWIDTATLQTLPEREYRSGLAEVVKYGVILDPALFRYMESESKAIARRNVDAVRRLIVRSCQLKAEIVQQDERETTGRRAILNFGHTFAHAFETVAGYGTWRHGEAVAAGMICASRLAERLNFCHEPDVTDRLRRLLRSLGLPTEPLRWNVAELLSVMRNDKKALAGRLRFVVPRRLGLVEVVPDVSEEVVAHVLQEVMTSGEANPR